MIYIEEENAEYEEDATSWIALADMMTGLMAIFLALAIAILVMQKGKRDAIVLTVSQKLEQSLKEQGINAKVENGRLMVSSDTNFESGQATLSEHGKQDYTKIIPIYAKAIFELPKNQQQAIDRIVIEGHTDKVGSYTNNMTLSTQRANAIVSHIETMPEFNYKQQFMQKLTAVGRGENDATGSETLGNPADRKVVIRFEFNDYEKIDKVKNNIERQLSN